MIRRIPQTGQWTGIYPGDVFGDLWKTFNIDLNRKEGIAALSERLIRIQDTFSAASGPFIAFLRSDADCTDRYWALSHEIGANSGQLIKTDSSSYGALNPSNDWDTDPLVNSPTDPMDFTIHAKDSRNDSGRDKIFVTRDTGDIAVLNDTGDNTWTASWWVTKHSQPALNTSVIRHPIQYLPFRKISLIGDGNLVHTISRPSDSQNDTVTYSRLVLPPQYEVWHIFATENRAWLNCFHKFGGYGAVVEWDGFSQTFNAIHNIPGAVPLGGISNGGTPTVVSPRGQMLEFVGNAFAPMIRNGRNVAFPIFDETDNSLIVRADSSMEVFLQPRGMVVAEDGLIYLNVRQPEIESFKQGAGIWCLNPNTGIMNNKYSLGANGIGDSGIQFGHQYISKVGGLYSVSSHTTGSSLLAGGILFTQANSSVTSNLWLSESLNETFFTKGANRGYFITSFIYASEIKEFWDTLWVRVSRGKSSVSAVVVKARGVRPMVNQNYKPLLGTVTWTSTTTFTVTLNSSDEAIQVGDEVELVGGVDGGRTAHITVISGNHAALQTVTIDEAVPTGSTSSYVFFDRWKKIKTFNTNNKYEEEMNIGIDSSFIQFKVELRGHASDMVMKDLTVMSTPSLNLKR